MHDVESHKLGVHLDTCNTLLRVSPKLWFVDKTTALPFTTLPPLLVFAPPSCLMKSIYLVYSLDSVISTSYRFPLQEGGKLTVEEKMVESRLSYYLPILFL